MIEFKKKGQRLEVRGKLITEANLTEKVYQWVISVNPQFEKYFKKENPKKDGKETTKA